jgi:NAD(P)-dependent dehydrogenase (short-subunit alcohol dehydrogenase family)
VWLGLIPGVNHEHSQGSDRAVALGHGRPSRARRPCEITGRIKNFAVAGKLEAGKHQGALYNDSDVYKVIEGIAYTLSGRRDADLDRAAFWSGPSSSAFGRDWTAHTEIAMQLRDKVVVVTGGANGIGRALCRRFAAEDARGVVVADLDADGARRVAEEIGGQAVAADVSVEADLVRLVERATAAYGPVDLFCSNAGIAVEGGVEVPDEAWRHIWDVNVMAHVYAARAVLPGMLARAHGYLLQTASAAGLLTQIGSAPYAVTKHAAVAFAEWPAITYGAAGIKVSCLCPQGVRTDMLLGTFGGVGDVLREGAIEPVAVADAVVAGLAEERFLILPHPEVAEYFRRKAGDYDRWLRGMRRLQERVLGPRPSGTAPAL